MIARYQYVFDAPYCRKVISRFYRQRPFYLKLHYQFAAIAAIVLLAWYSTRVTPQSPKTLLIAVSSAAAAVLIGIFLVRASVMTKLRGTKEFGKEVTIALSEEGLEAIGPNGHSVVKWKAYPKSVRFRDGILLLRGGVIRWLPDSAIAEGTVQEAWALIQSKTTSRSIGV